MAALELFHQPVMKTDGEDDINSQGAGLLLIISNIVCLWLLLFIAINLCMHGVHPLSLVFIVSFFQGYMRDVIT